jgi:hypothetical protein
MMDEMIAAAAIRHYKTVSFAVVKPLDFTCSHSKFLLRPATAQHRQLTHSLNDAKLTGTPLAFMGTSQPSRDKGFLANELNLLDYKKSLLSMRFFIFVHFCKFLADYSSDRV